MIENIESFESKGLGLLPEIYSEELAHNDVVLFDLVSDSGNACTFSEIDCDVENVFEVDSVKLDMALILNDRQGLVLFSFSVGDELEMGDSSGPPFQVYKGLEMCDSSRLVSLGSSFAMS